jgi:hypothetical protein
MEVRDTSNAPQKFWFLELMSQGSFLSSNSEASCLSLRRQPLRSAQRQPKPGNLWIAGLSMIPTAVCR